VIPFFSGMRIAWSFPQNITNLWKTN
jgi:hypothetical protein